MSRRRSSSSATGSLPERDIVMGPPSSNTAPVLAPASPSSKLKRRFFELEEKPKETTADLEGAGERNVRMREERSPLLDVSHGLESIQPTNEPLSANPSAPSNSGEAHPSSPRSTFQSPVSTISPYASSLDGPARTSYGSDRRSSADANGVSHHNGGEADEQMTGSHVSPLNHPIERRVSEGSDVREAAAQSASASAIAPAASIHSGPRLRLRSPVPSTSAGRETGSSHYRTSYTSSQNQLLVSSTQPPKQTLPSSYGRENQEWQDYREPRHQQSDARSPSPKRADSYRQPAYPQHDSRHHPSDGHSLLTDSGPSAEGYMGYSPPSRSTQLIASDHSASQSLLREHSALSPEIIPGSTTSNTVQSSSSTPPAPNSAEAAESQTTMDVDNSPSEHAVVPNVPVGSVDAKDVPTTRKANGRGRGRARGRGRGKAGGRPKGKDREGAEEEQHAEDSSTENGLSQEVPSNTSMASHKDQNSANATSSALTNGENVASVPSTTTASAATANFSSSGAAPMQIDPALMENSGLQNVVDMPNKSDSDAARQKANSNVTKPPTTTPEVHINTSTVIQPTPSTSAVAPSPSTSATPSTSTPVSMNPYSLLYGANAVTTPITPPFPFPPYYAYPMAMAPGMFIPPPSIPPPAAQRPPVEPPRQAKPKRLKAHTVTTKSFSIPMVPRDKSRKPMLPLNVGIMTVISLGEVCMREHFHTERYIFPVGYEVTRYVNLVVLGTRC
ncbi:hypothetical protein HGRIS_006422 [Hohenbuehelia grisea]|uniref:Uncharacterized protein n=1 Tax=Hohenbuehelia grisea TaxID=104357 RepID=A0ABR3K0Y6_9AGAR